MIAYAIDNNIDYKKSSIKSIICIGEPIRKSNFTYNELGKRIVSQWNVELYSTYASTEMGAAFTECKHGKGGHQNPKLLILEVIDENNNAVENGGLGEVIVTTLGVEGMPLIRYRTGDLCNVYYDPCDCGRISPRLGPIVGRKQQMIKFKGTTIFPPAIFDVLDMMNKVNLYQVQVSKTEFNNDNITIILSDDLDNDSFIKEISSLFKSKLRVTPLFKFVPKNELSKMVFKEEKRKPEKLVYKQ